MSQKHVLYLLLGANLDDRIKSFISATDLIANRIGPVVRASSLYETAPWGVLDQPAFLNQILEVETSLDPQAVLTLVLNIEKELGRVRHERWAARLIDIDILYYDDQVIAMEGLTIPHPRLHERRFTLAPLAEVAPEFVHPILKRNNLQLLADCTDDGEVTVFS